MRDMIAYAVNVALKGSRKVKITFRRECVRDIPYLLGMIKAKVVEVDSATEMNLRAVLGSYNWGDDSNRTVTVVLAAGFDESWFASRLYRALENIEAVQ